MREVPAKLFGFMREMSRRAGADIEAAQAGLALRHVNVDIPGERVDWDDVARFLERAHGHMSQEELERLGATYVDTHLWQQVLARVLGTPRLLCQMACGPLAQAAFPHIQFEVESHPTRLRFELRLPERYEPSRVFFAATAGELRALPAQVGRPPARVDSDVGPRHGFYDVHFDEPPMMLDRAVAAAGHAYDLVAAETIRLMDRAVRGDNRAADPTVLELQREIGLTHMEARVTARLAAGLSPQEIARALGIRVSTVRSHLKAAYAKSGTSGQADLIRFVLRREFRDRGSR